MAHITPTSLSTFQPPLFLAKNSSYWSKGLQSTSIVSRPSTSSSFRHIHTFFQLSYRSHLPQAIHTHLLAQISTHFTNTPSRRAGRSISSQLKQHTTLEHTICRLRHHHLHPAYIEDAPVASSTVNTSRTTTQVISNHHTTTKWSVVVPKSSATSRRHHSKFQWQSHATRVTPTSGLPKVQSQ